MHIASLSDKDAVQTASCAVMDTNVGMILPVLSLLESRSQIQQKGAFALLCSVS